MRDDATIFRQRQWQMHVGSGGHIEGQNDIYWKVVAGFPAAMSSFTTAESAAVDGELRDCLLLCKEMLVLACDRGFCFESRGPRLFLRGIAHICARSGLSGCSRKSPKGTLSWHRQGHGHGLGCGLLQVSPGLHWGAHLWVEG